MLPKTAIVRYWMLLILALYELPARTSGQQPSITVINIIPKLLSAENNQDSEPNLAVNPANVNQMASSAFTPGLGFCGIETAPIFVSVNGGSSWAANCIVPSDESGMTEDITLRFGDSSSSTYAWMLRRP